MEDETKMSEEKTSGELPEIKPLEEHKTNSMSKEIHPKSSKWLWLFIVLIFLFAAFGFALYVMQENEKLSNELEANYLPKSERLTSRALKGIGNTLSEAKSVLDKNGEDELVRLLATQSAGLGFSLSTPTGWHMATGLAENDFELWLNPDPINISPRGGYPTELFFRVIEKEEDNTIEDVLALERENFKDLEESTIQSSSGVVVYKLQGEKETLTGTSIHTTYYFEAFNNLGDSKVYTIDSDFWSEENKQEYIPLLERMLDTLELHQFDNAEAEE